MFGLVVCALLLTTKEQTWNQDARRVAHQGWKDGHIHIDNIYLYIYRERERHIYIYIYIYIIYIHISKSMHTSMNGYVLSRYWMFLSINKNQNSHKLQLVRFESIESRDHFQLPPKHLACWSAKVGDYWASGKAFEADHRWFPVMTCWAYKMHIVCLMSFVNVF